MEVIGNFSWILSTDFAFLASLYRNRMNSDRFQPLVQHPTLYPNLKYSFGIGIWILTPKI